MLPASAASEMLLGAKASTATEQAASKSAPPQPAASSSGASVQLCSLPSIPLASALGRNPSASASALSPLHPNQALMHLKPRRLQASGYQRTLLVMEA